MALGRIKPQADSGHDGMLLLKTRRKAGAQAALEVSRRMEALERSAMVLVAISLSMAAFGIVGLMAALSEGSYALASLAGLMLVLAVGYSSVQARKQDEARENAHDIIEDLFREVSAVDTVSDEIREAHLKDKIDRDIRENLQMESLLENKCPLCEGLVVDYVCQNAECEKDWNYIGARYGRSIDSFDEEDDTEVGKLLDDGPRP